ncbi:hypothetical protein, partial [Paenibacillus phytohabitans]|uniref:hypothetical protein n=1 Tax=Paenibacillus phytohabitans TaxID=2654978 RepID=UPI00300B82D9
AGYLILKKFKDIKIKKSYVFIGIILLLIITLLRGTSGYSLLDMGVLYYVGSFSYLELIMQHPMLYGLSNSLLYGYLTFGFLIEPFVLLLKLVFALDIDVPSYNFNIYTQTFVNIGETKSIFYNNNTTMLYTFIRDFGDFGIILGPALIAIAVCVVESTLNKYNNKLMVYFFVILYSLIVNSTMFYTMMSISSSLLIMFVLILSHNKKKSK